MSTSAPDDILGSYLTALLGWRGVGRPIGGPPGHTPARRRLYGTVLFADLSGFTAMTEALTADRSFGPERISGVLNEQMGSVVGAVHACGGDIIKFAGDAVLACWPATDRSTRGLALTAAAASRCGLEIIARQGRLAPIPGVPDLNMRVGVELGLLEVLHLGNAEIRRVLLVTGASVDGATEACSRAEPGQLRAGTHVRAALHNNSTIGPDGETILDISPSLRALPLPTAPKLPWDPTFSCYLPASVLHRVRSRQGRWMSELRAITAVFVRLPALRTGATPERMNEVFHATWQPIHRHGGIVNKLNIDEKGATVLAVFGLPPEVHEDDAVRACLAAQDAVKALSDIGARAQVGIATGKAFCGEIGATDRREYTVIGDAVNTAARLMQAVAQQDEGEDGATAVLVDAATAKRSSRRLHLDARPALRLKGKKAPVQVFAPTTEIGPTPHQRVQLVGRDAAVQQIVAAGRRLLDNHQGSAILVAGGAGLGKTALVDSVAECIAAAGCTTVHTRGEPLDQIQPGHNWAPVLARLYPPCPESGRQLIADAGADAGLLDTIADLLPPGLGPLPPATDSLAGHALRTRKAEVVVRLLRHATSRLPCAVFLEDAHLLDSLSLDILDGLLTAALPMLLIFTSRPPPDAPGHIWSRLRRAAIQVPLSTLDREDVAQLTAQLVGLPGQSPPAPLVELIFDRTGGNPLFVTALVEDLINRGAVEVVDGRTVVNPQEMQGDLGGLPVTLEAMLLSRLDRLSTEAQFTVKIAAVLGARFRRRDLAVVHPLVGAADELELDLGEIARMKVAEPEPGTHGEVWRFHQVLFRDAIYDILPLAQRRELHSRAAGRMVSKDFENTDWKAIANHAIAAEEPVTAVRALLTASRQVGRDGRNAESIALVDKADQLCQDYSITLPAADLRSRHEILSTAHLSDGRPSVARVHLQSLLSELGQRAIQRGVQGLLSLFWSIRIRPLGSAPTQTEADTAAAQAHLRLAWLEHRQGNDFDALAHAARAARLAPSASTAAGAAALIDRLLVANGSRPVSEGPPTEDVVWHVGVTRAATTLAMAPDETGISVATDRMYALLRSRQTLAESLGREQLLTDLAVVHLLRSEPYRILDDLHAAGHKTGTGATQDTLGSGALEAVRTIGLAACGSSWTVGDLNKLERALCRNHGPARAITLHAALARAAWHHGKPQDAREHILQAIQCWRAAPTMHPTPELILAGIAMSDTTLAALRGGEDGDAPAEQTGKLLRWLARGSAVAALLYHQHEALRHATAGRTLRAAWHTHRARAHAETWGMPAERADPVVMQPPHRRVETGLLTKIPAVDRPATLIPAEAAS